MNQCLRRNSLRKYIDASDSTIDRWIKLHGFPKPIPLGGSLAWLQSEVDAWIEVRKASRDQQQSSSSVA